MDDLVKRNGIHYKKFSNVPFSGKVTGQIQGTLKNCKREGAWITYWKNGQLRDAGNYKNGRMVGERVSYHDKGQVWLKGNYKNDKQEGAWFYFKENGERNDKLSGTYKNGKKISY